MFLWFSYGSPMGMGFDEDAWHRGIHGHAGRGGQAKAGLPWGRNQRGWAKGILYSIMLS